MESKLKEKDLFQSPKKIEEGDGEICSSNEVEKTKLVQLRAMLEKQDPSCKVHFFKIIINVYIYIKYHIIFLIPLWEMFQYY